MKLDLLLRFATCPVGDSEPGCRAFSFYGICSDLSVQFGYDSLGNGKSQSRSLFVFVQFHKTPEYVRQFVCRNTCSGVLYIKIQFGVSSFISDTYRTFGGELNRIGDKVGKYLCHPVAVGQDKAGRTCRFCYNFNHPAGVVHSHLEKLLQIRK